MCGCEKAVWMHQEFAVHHTAHCCMLQPFVFPVAAAPAVNNYDQRLTLVKYVVQM